MLVNRVGDFFILLAIFLLLFVFNSLDYSIIFNVAPKIVEYNYSIGVNNFFILDVICLFLFLGAMGKSAQLGLHVWLPDAMEGPTPVSALIHAATMVTAGVFLIARCSFLFELSPFVLNIIVLVGSLTAFFASTTGLFQNDIKKVIAYSTCSQLGYMFFACGLSCYEVGVFHLFNHAFFKALLFLGAGSIIHAIENEQDLRKMGGLKNLLPFSYSIMLIGSLALTGFPFLSGFYSKDVILEAAFSKHTSFSHFSYVLGSFGAFFTALYSTRLLFLVFLVTPNGNRSTIFNAHEGRFSLYFPLFVLAFFSLFIGFSCKDMFIGFGTDFWKDSIFELPHNYTLSDIEFINYFFKILPLILTFFGIFVGIFLYGYNLSFYMNVKKNNNFRKFYSFFNKKWYIDRIYAQLISQFYLKYSYFYSYKDVDRGILENVGPYSIVNNLNEVSNFLKIFQKGFIFDYLFLFFIIILIFVFFLLFLF
jgi:NADH-ubiquinone oxidoreductase chain 5